MANVQDYYPSNGRVILHIDMNAFYCSVHSADDPQQYKGKATAVSGSVEKRKGIIVTCSYEARKLGIRTGMNVREAQRIAPDLIFISPNFDLYRQYSKQFMKIAYQYTPVIEQVSIDECYLDITGSKIFGTPLDIAHTIQQRIAQELSLPCSIGIAPNKLLAKMASDMKKPNGITVLRKRDVPKLLWNKPCQELFGIGAKTAEKLKKLHINTIGELAAADDQLLLKSFGVIGGWMKAAANGIDDSEVKSEQEASKSIGHTTTLPVDLTNIDDINRVLLNLSDQTTRRLRRQRLVASTVQITIRRPDMSTITRSYTMPVPTHNLEQVYKHAQQLFEKHWVIGEPVRLLGVTLQNLKAEYEAAIQLDLFNYEEEPKKEALTKVMDQLRDKFGEHAVLTAGMLSDDPSSLIRNKKIRGTSLEKLDRDYLE
ncbi:MULTISPECIES: DNA polymerase IV [Paenibacillus]|uniref:DNA polymerase IV n=1 Tax=Paenibacillus TaxID=44249 RepID=UPI00203EA387|nr:DNA polymerase IV [Paenibacillus camelliae]MCM3635453.1 DNA polymerase IV [Paenibacillus camelliae]